MEKASIYVDDPVLFDTKVRHVSEQLEIPPEWLMAVMYSESRLMKHRYLIFQISCRKSVPKKCDNIHKISR